MSVLRGRQNTVDEAWNPLHRDQDEPFCRGSRRVGSSNWRPIFPQLVIDNQAIGGFDELRALDRAGKLVRVPSD